MLLTIASIFPIKTEGSITNSKTLIIILCDSSLACDVIWQVSIKVYIFPNHFMIKYGYCFTCMRSFNSLGQKGNILAILEELLVENPISFENKFGSQGVMEYFNNCYHKPLQAMSLFCCQLESRYCLWPIILRIWRKVCLTYVFHRDRFSTCKNVSWK